MLVERVAIVNYKGFTDFQLTFKKGLTVLYGKNGTGKSTIINSIKMLLEIINTKEGVNSKNIYINSSDYNDPGRDVSIKIEVLVDGVKKSFGMLKPSSSYGYEYRTSVPTAGPQQGITINQFDKKSTLADGTRFTGESDFFASPTVLAHHCSLIPGTLEPVVNTVQDAFGKLEVKVEFVKRYIMTRGFRDFQQHVNWYREKENLEQQLRLDGDNEYRDPQLQLFREAIKSFDSGFDGVKIDRKLPSQPLTVCKNGKYLPMDSLSEGEAIIVGLLLIATVMNYSTKSHITVIVDEIDNSLHPTWQMKILPTLTKVFPAWQFIVSSHSPFVWSQIDRKEVVFLQRNSNTGKVEAIPVSYSKGASVEEISAEFFDVSGSAADVQPLLTEIEGLILSGEKTKALELMKKLSKQYGDLPIVAHFNALITGLGL